MNLASELRAQGKTLGPTIAEALRLEKCENVGYAPLVASEVPG
jgi:hypothetical protein